MKRSGLSWFATRIALLAALSSTSAFAEIDVSEAAIIITPTITEVVVEPSSMDSNTSSETIAAISEEKLEQFQKERLEVLNELHIDP